MFENKVKFLSTLRHPNLVRLLGHCTENNQQLLVYEYMENGSLSNTLSANGLAFLHHKDESKAIIVHRNIQEYIAPVYLMKGSITEKVDVFSFGVSILVLSTEKRSIDLERLDTDAILLNQAKGLHQKGDLLSLIDEDLMPSNSLKEANMLLDLAMLCTYESPELRPSMSEVVNIDPLYVTTFSCDNIQL
ncbi:hypothetical protein MKW92_044393 [Papaver armeniacum]|nr:hypothetical protein MKW92_044393 [Papaver armeniacum]